MSAAYGESRARLAETASISMENAIAQRTAAPAARRALIIGYLTYRGDARVKRQVRTLAGAGYAVDVICLAEDMGEGTGCVSMIGIEVAGYQGGSRLRYIRCYGGFFIKAALTAARLAVRHRYDVAIHAMGLLRGRIPGIQLRLIGKGDALE